MEDKSELNSERTSGSPDGSRDAALDAAVAEDLRRALSRVRETWRSRGTPYPRDLRTRVIAFVRSRRLAGTSYQDLARLLGMHASTLQLWITSADKPSRGRGAVRGDAVGAELFAPETQPVFAPVRVVEERASAASARHLELHAPGGLRLTGLSAEEAALVLARLLELRR